MDAVLWNDIQEALLFIFSPWLFWWLVLLAAGGVLSGFGVVLLGVTARMTR